MSTPLLDSPVRRRSRKAAASFILAASSVALGLGAFFLDFYYVLVGALPLMFIAAVVLAILGLSETPTNPQIAGRGLAIGALCLLPLLALPLFLRMRSQTERSGDNLAQIAKALHRYHGDHKRFPASAIYGEDGKPLLSWRVAILPYLGQEELYDEFRLDEPWNSEHNAPLVRRIPPVYNFPPGDSGLTFYQVFIGKGAAFEGTQGLPISSFHDGSMFTILVIEGGDTVPWTKPADLTYDPDGPLPPLAGIFRGRKSFPDRPTRQTGSHAVYADGSVRFVNTESIDEGILRALITRNGREVLMSFDKEAKTGGHP